MVKFKSQLKSNKPEILKFEISHSQLSTDRDQDVEVHYSDIIGTKDKF